MIELVNVSKNYPTTSALKNINLSLTPGEIVGIVGKSGSGKSTLLRLLNLMEIPSEGSILIDGIDSRTFTKKDLRYQQQQMALVFQNFNLLENLNAYDNVALPLKLLKEKQPEKIQQLLSFVDMSHKAAAYPAQLSGGEKQRIGIARALSRTPNWLFCDEATSSLDEENTASVVSLLKKTHQEFRPTIVFVSHELQTLKSLCQRILVLENGRLIGDFQNNPQQFPVENLSYLEKVERSLQP